MKALLGWWMRLRRRWKIAVASVAVLILLVAITPSPDEPDPASTVASPAATQATTVAPTATAEPTATASPVETDELYAEFDQQMIRVRLVTKEGLGGQAEVHFVDERPGVDLYDLAKQCVFAEQDTGLLAAYCYGFDSEEDLEFAQIDTDNGGMLNLCYRAAFGISLALSFTEIPDNETVYGVSGCPGADGG